MNLKDFFQPVPDIDLAASNVNSRPSLPAVLVVALGEHIFSAARLAHPPLKTLHRPLQSPQTTSAKSAHRTRIRESCHEKACTARPELTLPLGAQKN
jgi:hypothetical protein